MKISSYHELLPRGTPDFPVELYVVTENHPRYNMQFHWHSDIEIVHVSKGTLALTLNDSHYNLKTGESILIPGGVAHGAIPSSCEYECLRFSKSILYAAPDIKKLIKAKLLYPVEFSENEDVQKLFSVMRKENLNQLQLMSLVFSVVDEAVKKQDGTKTISEEKIERIKPAIIYVEDNYHTHITVADLAGKCLMSSNYFIKYFKDVTDQTPVEFLNRHRIEAACEMLLSGYSVTHTAFSCGFNDLSYFIHIFKKEIGISPKKYAMQKMCCKIYLSIFCFAVLTDEMSILLPVCASKS